MDFIPTLPSYGSDLCAQTVWNWYAELLENRKERHTISTRSSERRVPPSLI